MIWQFFSFAAILSLIPKEDTINTEAQEEVYLRLLKSAVAQCVE